MNVIVKSKTKDTAFLRYLQKTIDDAFINKNIETQTNIKRNKKKEKEQEEEKQVIATEIKIIQTRSQSKKLRDGQTVVAATSNENTKTKNNVKQKKIEETKREICTRSKSKKLV